MTSKRRVYLFGIGSPDWQRKTGHIVSELGVPIPSHGPAKLRHHRHPKRRKARRR